MVSNAESDDEQVRDALNKTGDMPLLHTRYDWPWVNSRGLPGCVLNAEAQGLEDAGGVDSEAEEERNMALFFGDCLPGVAAARREKELLRLLEGRGQGTPASVATEGVGNVVGVEVGGKIGLGQVAAGLERARRSEKDGPGVQANKKTPSQGHAKCRSSIDSGPSDHARSDDESWGSGCLDVRVGAGTHVLGGRLEREWLFARSSRRTEHAEEGVNATGRGWKTKGAWGRKQWWQKKKAMGGAQEDEQAEGKQNGMERDFGRIILSRNVSFCGVETVVGTGPGAVKVEGGQDGGIPERTEGTSLSQGDAENDGLAVVEGQWVLLKGGGGMIGDLRTCLDACDSIVHF